jgi:hypothetical protein
MPAQTTKTPVKFEVDTQSRPVLHTTTKPLYDKFLVAIKQQPLPKDIQKTLHELHVAVNHLKESGNTRIHQLKRLTASSEAEKIRILKLKEQKENELNKLKPSIEDLIKANEIAKGLLADAKSNYDAKDDVLHAAEDRLHHEKHSHGHKSKNVDVLRAEVDKHYHALLALGVSIHAPGGPATTAAAAQDKVKTREDLIKKGKVISQYASHVVKASDRLEEINDAWRKIDDVVTEFVKKAKGAETELRETKIDGVGEDAERVDDIVSALGKKWIALEAVFAKAHEEEQAYIFWCSECYEQGRTQDKGKGLGVFPLGAGRRDCEGILCKDCFNAEYKQ